MANMRIGRNDENLTNNGHGNDEKHRNYYEKKYTFNFDNVINMPNLIH